MRSFGKSVAGMQRKNNEDSIYTGGENAPVKNVFIVADGMGGHNAGEVASSLAIDTFVEYIKENYDSENLLDILVEGVVKANKVVFEEAVNNENENGMGTHLHVYALKIKSFMQCMWVTAVYIYLEKKALNR